MLTAHATAHTAQRRLAAQRLQHAMPSPSWLTTWPNTDPLLSLRRLASTSSSTFMQVTKCGESAPEAPWHPPIGDRAARGAWSALLRCLMLVSLSGSANFAACCLSVNGQPGSGPRAGPVPPAPQVKPCKKCSSFLRSSVAWLEVPSP